MFYLFTEPLLGMQMCEPPASHCGLRVGGRTSGSAFSAW